MPTFTLPAKPAVAAAFRAGAPITARLTELATQAGYVIGPGGIQVYPDGRVTIDADRDPSADWATFDPTVPTPVEAADTALRQAVAAARAGLLQIDERVRLPDPLTQTEIKTALARLAGTLNDLIGVLDRRGFLED